MSKEETLSPRELMQHKFLRLPREVLCAVDFGRDSRLIVTISASGLGLRPYRKNHLVSSDIRVVGLGPVLTVPSCYDFIELLRKCDGGSLDIERKGYRVRMVPAIDAACLDLEISQGTTGICFKLTRDVCSQLLSFIESTLDPDLYNGAQEGEKKLPVPTFGL